MYLRHKDTDFSDEHFWLICHYQDLCDHIDCFGSCSVNCHSFGGFKVTCIQEFGECPARSQWPPGNARILDLLLLPKRVWGLNWIQINKSAAHKIVIFQRNQLFLYKNVKIYHFLFTKWVYSVWTVQLWTAVAEKLVCVRIESRFGLQSKHVYSDNFRYPGI